MLDKLLEIYYRKTKQAETIMKGITPAEIANGTRTKEMFGKNGALGFLMDNSNKGGNFNLLFKVVRICYQNVKIDTLLLEAFKNTAEIEEFSRTIKEYAEKLKKSFADIEKIIPVNEVKDAKSEFNKIKTSLNQALSTIILIANQIISRPANAENDMQVVLKSLLPESTVGLAIGAATQYLGKLKVSRKFTKQFETGLHSLKEHLKKTKIYQKNFTANTFSRSFSQLLKTAYDAAFKYKQEKHKKHPKRDFNPADKTKLAYCELVMAGYSAYAMGNMRLK